MRALSVVLIVAAVALGACGPDDASFRASNAGAQELVQDELGDDRFVDAACSPGLCSVEYRSEVVGTSTELELLRDQRKLWPRLFSDPRMQRAVLIAHGDAGLVGGKAREGALLRVACTREADRRIDWVNVDVKSVKAFCSWDRSRRVIRSARCYRGTFA